MLIRRPLALALVLGLLLPSIALIPPVARRVEAAAPAAFASPLFERVWIRGDGPVAQGAAARSWLWGPQPGATEAEAYAGAPGGTRTVQYFDKARMEINPAVSDPTSPWAVSTGLLVVELVTGRVQTGSDSWEARAPAEVPVAGDAGTGPESGAPVYRSFHDLASLPGGPDRRVLEAKGAPVRATIDRAGTVSQGADDGVRYSAYAPETGHNIPDVFARFMSSRGLVAEAGGLVPGPLFDSVYLLGYPISEAYWAIVPVDGQPQRVLLQLYQRRVLTYIPAFPAAWQVQMGNVGQHYYAWRYAAPTAAPPAGEIPPVPPPDFVQVAGDHFVVDGQAVVLKGTNYWLHTAPFVSTWAAWDGPLALEDLAKARDLGVNTIRIGLPYDHSTSADVVWGAGCSDKDVDPKDCMEVHGWIANQMTQLLQIASVYGMKVIFVLFDWSDSFPSPGGSAYGRQLNYLQGVVAPFADDDRVLAWDLHNEPENYPTWEGHPDQVVAWTGRMAGAVRALDRRHPITVGLAHAETLLAGPGARLGDVVDFVSFHSYDAGALRDQIPALQARTSKPILLEEMGWPSGPAELSTAAADYSEATQQYLYRTMLADARAAGLAGVVQWTLWDFPRGLTTGYKGPSYEEWFGLVRLDGGFKPAAADFRDAYPAPLLPSRTATYEPLTPTHR